MGSRAGSGVYPLPDWNSTGSSRRYFTECRLSSCKETGTAAHAEPPILPIPLVASARQSLAPTALALVPQSLGDALAPWEQVI